MGKLSEYGNCVPNFHFLSCIFHFNLITGEIIIPFACNGESNGICSIGLAEVSATNMCLVVEDKVMNLPCPQLLVPTSHENWLVLVNNSGLSLRNFISRE